MKIPGMHRPAPSDVDAHVGRALGESPELVGRMEAVKRLLADGDFVAARERLDGLATAITEAKLSPPARRVAERGLAELRDALGEDAYWRQSTWRRIAVISAGPATNVVFAVALLAAVFMLGVPAGVDPTVEAVVPGSPAAKAGLRPGDRVVAVNGRAAEPEQISERIRASDGRPVRLTVERGGERRQLPAARPRKEQGAYRLGFALRWRYERYGPVEATKLAGEDTWAVTKAIGVSLGELVTGENREDVSSPVGIVRGSSEALEVGGFRYYLQILALISLSLALLNLLPLLPLDGGHIVFSLIEGIRGRALGREVYERVSFVGIALVLFLFAIGLSNDISDLSGG